MSHRLLASLGILAAVIGVGSLAPVPVGGQASTAAPTTAKTWSAPKTPWGDPDLQGVWTNFDETPFELPPADAALAEAVRAAATRRSGGVGRTALGWDANDSPKSPRRPSLVVDPPDGRIPVRPGATAFRNLDLWAVSWEGHTPGERCITRGVPAVMYPDNYDSAYQILQNPGYVAIVAERLHEIRIIPLDGRPHVGSGIRLWNGDPRGHWEGDTLVIDSTNYNTKGTVWSGPAVIIPQTETSHTVERFTPVDAHTINYQVTFDDPHVFTQAWTMALPLNRDQKYQIYESACHEGNKRYMEGSLTAGRPLDKAVENAAKRKN